MTEEARLQEVERIENMILQEYGTTLTQAIDLPDFDSDQEGGESAYLVQ